MSYRDQEDVSEIKVEVTFDSDAPGVYVVKATRAGDYWELDVEGVGVTQSVTLAGAERSVRSYLAMDDHADAAAAGLMFKYSAGAKVDAALEDARRKAMLAEAARDEAAAFSRRAAGMLLKVMSGQDAARVLGISPQRVSQLVKP